MSREIASVLDFLKRLKEEGVYYTLRISRPYAIMVQVEIPGEKWEIEFLQDGSVEVEIFRSDGEILDDSAIERLFQELMEGEEEAGRLGLRDRPSKKN